MVNHSQLLPMAATTDLEPGVANVAKQNISVGDQRLARLRLHNLPHVVLKNVDGVACPQPPCGEWLGSTAMPFSERERQKKKGKRGSMRSTSVSPTRHRARAVQGMAIMSATVAARANAVRTALRSASLSASPCRHKKREMGGRCVGGKLCMGGDDGRGGGEHVTAPVLPFVKKCSGRDQHK